MTANQKFGIISSVAQVFPILLALALMHFSPVPRKPAFRALVSIVIPWVALVIYMGTIYNPAGIAAGHEVGADFPEGRFDNNTIASALLGGWLIPAPVIGVYFLGRRSARAQQAIQERRAQENARAS